MTRTTLFVVAFSLACPCFGQQTQGGGEPDANTATNQGNQAVQGGEIATTEITGDGVRTGGLTENGGLQSAFGASDANSFFTAITNAAGQGGGRGNTRQFNITGGGTGQQRTGGSTSKTRQVRPRFRLGFDRSKSLSSSNVQSRSTARLSKLSSRLKSVRGVKASAGPNGVVTLTGRVDSAAAKRLATNLLRLEPGVRSVKNQIEVAAAAAPQPTKGG